MQPVLVQRDVEATVARILILNDDIFLRFEKLVSRNVRATAFLEKMGTKAKDTFDLLDDYCELGPVFGRHDLNWAAQTLVDIGDSVIANVAERQPLNLSTPRSEADKALVSILSMVVRERKHNYCQHESTWPRRRPLGEQLIDRILYERLIKSTSHANPSGGNFVIKAEVCWCYRQESEANKLSISGHSRSFS